MMITLYDGLTGRMRVAEGLLRCLRYENIIQCAKRFKTEFGEIIELEFKMQN